MEGGKRNINTGKCLWRITSWERRRDGAFSWILDQGKDLHVVIRRKDPNKGGKIIHLGVYKDWAEVDRLMVNFRILRCLVDALPETRNARAFADRHQKKVFLNYYNEQQKGKYSWNGKDLTGSCSRTESLDASHNEIMGGTGNPAQRVRDCPGVYPSPPQCCQAAGRERGNGSQTVCLFAIGS